jgi:thymidylate synthase
MSEGKRVVTRGQKTMELSPVLMKIKHPRKRYIRTLERKFSPRAATAEFLWYMTANPRLGEILKHVPRWKDFSDDGEFVNSNYGVQWKNQIPSLIEILKKDRGTRRFVVTMYEGSKFSKMESKDIPCTVSIQFIERNGILEMIVFMRSNDLWWGFCNDQWCFSLLQELIANELKLQVGSYWHFTSSLHVYERHWDKEFVEDPQLFLNATKTYCNFNTFWTDLMSQMKTVKQKSIEEFSDDIIAHTCFNEKIDVQAFFEEYHGIRREK